MTRCEYGREFFLLLEDGCLGKRSPFPPFCQIRLDTLRKQSNNNFANKMRQRKTATRTFSSGIWYMSKVELIVSLLMRLDYIFSGASALLKGAIILIALARHWQYQQQQHQPRESATATTTKIN